MRKKYSNINTLEEIENFIKKEGISNRTILQNNYLSVYKKFCKLPEKERDRILPKIYDYSYLQDKEDFKKFILEKNIESRIQFDENYPGIYKRFKNLLTDEEQNELIPSKIPNYRNLNDTDDFAKFIEDNHIVSRKDFGNRFYKAYKKFLSLSKEEQNKIVFEIDITMHHTDWVLNSVDDFKKFFKEKDIKSKIELQKNYNWAYHRFYTILTEEERNTIVFSTGNRNLKNLESLENFQKFIDENQIQSYSEFVKTYRGAYGKFCSIIGTEGKSLLKFPLDKPIKSSISSGENYLITLFNNNNINFIQQKEFDDLVGDSKKRTRCLRFDFFLPDINSLVEYHGSQHFDKNNRFYSDKLIIYDKKKYQYAVDHSIHIFYFTLEKSYVDKFGYFAEVITDPDILINKIKEIGPTNRSNN